MAKSFAGLLFIVYDAKKIKKFPKVFQKLKILKKHPAEIGVFEKNGWVSLYTTISTYYVVVESESLSLRGFRAATYFGLRPISGYDL